MQEFLFRLLKPATWSNSLEIDEDVDSFVNKLIDEDLFTGFGIYVASFKHKDKTIDIWTANFPYAYGNIYRIDGRKFSYSGKGIKFKTRYKLNSYLLKKANDQMKNELHNLIQGK